jgi:glycosyltransferase involved in cell wall biosynthesis
MEVTISIINYNYGQYLKQAIESALNQTTTVDFEVLVIDDGSTDNSDEIITTYESHSKFRSSKTENRGFGAALTRALIEAKGDYVFFMDADDHFFAKKVATILPILQNNNYYFVADSPNPFDSEGNFYPNNFSAGCTSTIAVNRKKAMVLCPVENEIWYNSLAALGFGIYLKESYTSYRMHNYSMTNRNIPGKQNDYLSSVTHNLFKQLFKDSNKIAMELGISVSKVIRVSYKFKSLAYYNELEMHLELGNRLEAFKAFKKMFYYNLIKNYRIKLFDIKMLVRVILLWPSHKK